jgi:hypothetical protein
MVLLRSYFRNERDHAIGLQTPALALGTGAAAQVPVEAPVAPPPFALSLSKGERLQFTDSGAVHASILRQAQDFSTNGTTRGC